MSSLQPTLVYLLYKCFARAFNSNETRSRTERITVTRYLELNSGLLRRQGGSGLALGQFKIPRAGYSHRTPTRLVTTTPSFHSCLHISSKYEWLRTSLEAAEKQKAALVDLKDEPEKSKELSAWWCINQLLGGDSAN